VSSTNWWKIGD